MAQPLFHARVDRMFFKIRIFRNFWYNESMVKSLVTVCSHLLFIYLAHYLLLSVVDWSKLVKGTAENQKKIQLFIVFVAIALGYLVSAFFLDVLSISRNLTEVLR